MGIDLRNTTALIVKQYVSNNPVAPNELSSLIHSVYTALTDIEKGTTPEDIAEAAEPAVPIKKSVTPDHIVCLECGKKAKMLRRHLLTDHGLIPDEYRARWSLPANYPFTAPNYSKRRAVLAREIGLGTTYRPKR
ncbi:MucR family transcriptional regulator [Azospirillum sp. SYSU D00513]|uniref:MucR family transcriptional regulator n=1 Tax=Azospirillum sp. SYSU D00513 TaxID=2812561 RepID=UPI001A956D39|nr:MucR family transcriptional regulator [Azospirillum sp. SYSU D00513]